MHKRTHMNNICELIITSVVKIILNIIPETFLTLRLINCIVKLWEIISEMYTCQMGIHNLSYGQYIAIFSLLFHIQSFGTFLFKGNFPKNIAFSYFSIESPYLLLHLHYP